jgi:hypothetical protein
LKKVAKSKAMFEVILKSRVFFVFISSLLVASCRSRRFNELKSFRSSEKDAFLACPLKSETAPLRTLPALHLLNRALVLLSGEIDVDENIEQSEEIEFVQNQFNNYQAASSGSKTLESVCDVIEYLTESVPYLGYIELDIQEWKESKWRPSQKTDRLQIAPGSEAERYLQRVIKNFKAQMQKAQNSQNSPLHWKLALGDSKITEFIQAAESAPIEDLNSQILLALKPLVESREKLTKLSQTFADFRLKSDAALLDQKNILKKIESISESNDSASSKILATVLGSYFSSLDRGVKANITLDLLDESASLESPEEFFKIFINRSGPQFLKLLQLQVPMKLVSKCCRQS